MKIRCIIVDDEALAREGMEAILSDRQDITVMRSCSDGLSAINAIETLKPELVFLDVQMPGVNGFEVIASLPKPRPHVIFVTAHDHYAIRAFEINAVDYLLKPFSDARFDAALQKATDLLMKEELTRNLAIENLIDHTKKKTRASRHLLSGAGVDNSIVFKSDGQVHRLAFPEITHVEAYDYYVKIHTAGQYFLIRETMKKMEQQLPADLFMRVHKSYIVNINFIRQYGKGEDDHYAITLRNDVVLRVGRSYKKEVDKLFG